MEKKNCTNWANMDSSFDDDSFDAQGIYELVQQVATLKCIPKLSPHSQSPQSRYHVQHARQHTKTEASPRSIMCGAQIFTNFSVKT